MIRFENNVFCRYLFDCDKFIYDPLKNNVPNIKTVPGKTCKCKNYLFQRNINVEHIHYYYPFYNVMLK